MLVPVILSGGSGTRLWPLSRTHYPKQFIDLVNKTTLFQDTILRLPDDLSNPLIICNEDHRFFAAEQLRQIDKKSWVATRVSETKENLVNHVILK